MTIIRREIVVTAGQVLTAKFLQSSGSDKTFGAQYTIMSNNLKIQRIA